MGRFSVNMDRVTVDELVIGEQGPNYQLFDAGPDRTAMVFERPTLAGYLVEQVARGRARLSAFNRNGFASGQALIALGDIVEAEGGQRFDYRPKEDCLPGFTILQAGKFTIECSLSPHPAGGVGRPYVTPYTRADHAAAAFLTHAELVEHVILEGVVDRTPKPPVPILNVLAVSVHL